MSCFASVGLRILKCSKIGHARRWGSLTREITLNDKFLSQSLPDLEVLLMTLKQLFKVFVKISVFDCNRATYTSLWGQNQRWVTSEWVNAQKTSRFHRNPFHGRIESIKSAGKRSWKVTLEACTGVFLDKFISRRIPVSWYAIWRVNPSGPALIWITFCPGSHFVHE